MIIYSGYHKWENSSKFQKTVTVTEQADQRSWRSPGLTRFWCVFVSKTTRPEQWDSTVEIMTSYMYALFYSFLWHLFWGKQALWSHMRLRLPCVIVGLKASFVHCRWLHNGVYYWHCPHILNISHSGATIPIQTVIWPFSLHYFTSLPKLVLFSGLAFHRKTKIRPALCWQTTNLELDPAVGGGLCCPWGQPN